MPVKESLMARGKSRGTAPGKRHIEQRNKGKYSLHDAGFVALVLQDYRNRVHITDNSGQILLRKQLSQGAFVQEWQRTSGEEQLSAQHLRKWLSKGSTPGPAGESAVDKVERQRNEAFAYFSSLKRDTLS
eukprot:EG_transcript_30992